VSLHSLPFLNFPPFSALLGSQSQSQIYKQSNPNSLYITVDWVCQTRGARRGLEVGRERS
jgi:hypothetical protein